MFFVLNTESKELQWEVTENHTDMLCLSSFAVQIKLYAVICKIL